MSEKVHIYGTPISQPTRSILIFCKLSSIPYEFHFVNLPKGEHLTDEFARINPFRLVPAIVHGDFTLWEGAAIIQYLADAYNVDNQWYPKDPMIRARINAYLHWHHQGTRDQLIGLIRGKVIYPRFYGMPGITPEEEVPLREKFEGYFKTLKWLLGETGNIARTQELTIADVFAYTEIAQAWLIGFDINTQSEVKEWFEKIGNIEDVRENHKSLKKLVEEYNS